MQSLLLPLLSVLPLVSPEEANRRSRCFVVFYLLWFLDIGQDWGHAILFPDFWSLIACCFYSVLIILILPLVYLCLLWGRVKSV